MVEFVNHYSMDDLDPGSAFARVSVAVNQNFEACARQFAQQAGEAGADAGQIKGVILHALAIALVEVSKGDMPRVEYYLRKAQQGRALAALQRGAA